MVCRAIYTVCDDSNDQVNTGLNPVGDTFTYIPLWHAVYHEYLMLRSCITIIDGRDMRYYLRGLAVALTWGEVPMVDMDPQGTGLPCDLELYDTNMLQYSRRIAQARATYAYPYLVEGAMLRPPKIGGVPLTTIPAVSGIPYSGSDVPSFESPAVFGSSWQSVDGSIGVVLTSISDRSINVNLSLPYLSETDQTRYLAYTVCNGNFTLLSSEMTHRSLNITVSPLDVILFVLTTSNSTHGEAAKSLNQGYEAMEALARQGYNVYNAKELVSKAAVAFFARNYTKEYSFLGLLPGRLTIIKDTTDLIRSVEDNLTHVDSSNFRKPKSVLMLRLASSKLLGAFSALSHCNYTRAVQLAAQAQRLIEQAQKAQATYYFTVLDQEGYTEMLRLMCLASLTVLVAIVGIGLLIFFIRKKLIRFD